MEKLLTALKIYLIDPIAHIVFQYVGYKRKMLIEWKVWPKVKTLIGIAISPDRKIYLASSNTIYISDFGGRLLCEWKIEPRYFIRIAFHENKTYLLSENKIQILNSKGFLLRETVMISKVNFCGIAITNNCLYVTDDIESPGYGSTVHLLSLEGKHLQRWGRKGSEEGNFNRPYGICISPQNEVYIADTFNHRVQVLTLEGKFLRSWGNHEYFDQLSFPMDIAFSNGKVYLTEASTHNIKVFTPKGDFLYSLDKDTEKGTEKDTEKRRYPGLERSLMAVSSKEEVCLINRRNDSVRIFKVVPDYQN